MNNIEQIQKIEEEIQYEKKLIDKRQKEIGIARTMINMSLHRVEELEGRLLKLKHDNQ